MPNEVTRQVRVVIADDHAILRAGLRRLLVHQARYDVVGEASGGEQALDEVLRNQPDVLLLDLWMPDTDPTELIEELCVRAPNVKVIVMTAEKRPESLCRALSSGAYGLVHKLSGFERMREAIEHVLAGERYLDPDLPVTPAPFGVDGLTTREQQILVHLARGAAYRDIGLLFQISARTVETYRRRIGDKLGLRTRAELTKFALQHGLLAA